jgi:twitching motility protein PilT
MSVHDRPTLDLPQTLFDMVARDGSDLLLKAGNRPLVRVDGELNCFDESAALLEAWEIQQILHEMLPGSKLKAFENDHEVDFAYSVPRLARFRVAAYMQRGTVSIALRLIPLSIKSIVDLGLPDVIRRLAEEQRGVILVTGTTSSGKSTTLAAMIAHINATTRKHVVTIEDPIEYLHRDNMSAIDQREVGEDTASFGTALRRVLRQDPDIILIGEMRDEETVRTALSAAETGHLVLSTLHTMDAAETINRIIDFFQPHEHQHVRAMLAGTLKGIISQRLTPRVDGNGRVAICEVLTMTGRVHDTILDPTSQTSLNDIVSEGSFYGMQTFDQALYEAYAKGDVSLSDALNAASHPHDFKLLVSSEGRGSTSMDDLADAVEPDVVPVPVPVQPPPAPVEVSLVERLVEGLQAVDGASGASKAAEPKREPGPDPPAERVVAPVVPGAAPRVRQSAPPVLPTPTLSRASVGPPRRP